MKKRLPPIAAYFGFYLMAMGSGRPRRPDEIAGLLNAAGFGDIAQRRTRQPLLTGARFRPASGGQLS